MTHLEAVGRRGLTSEIVSVIFNGAKCWKEQWFYNGEPVDYRRTESISEFKQRTGVK
jgi:hypothetical protein